jgi:sugar lactone lactonase YvrE
MRTLRDILVNPLAIISAGNTLGEGVLWDAERQCVWWTDIQERKLFRYDPATHVVLEFDTPERVCSFGLVEGSEALLTAFESGIAFYDPHSKTLDWRIRPNFGKAGLRFNDGRMDRQGRFWTGTMYEGQESLAAASLYRFDRRGELSVHATHIRISNGICWSPDSTKFYFSDSPSRTIFVYDFDAESGTISNRKVFAQTPEGAYPDGANVDSAGHVWSAHWGAGRVVGYTPEGDVAMVIDTPASQPTCVAFGGRNLDLMYVTSARDGLNEAALMGQPHAGDVFVYKMSVPGLSDGYFSQ